MAEYRRGAADLGGKTILVTNADQPAGRAAARACLEAGGRVLAHYDPLSGPGQILAGELGVRAGDMIGADLSIPEHPTALWNAAADRVSRIDALVNVAGIYRPSFLNGGDLVWMESWRRALQVNLTAPADLCRAAFPHFSAHGGGAIVNLAHSAREETGGALDAAYMAARGGLVSLTRNLARAFAAQDVAMYVLAARDVDAPEPEGRGGELLEWVRLTPYPSIVDVESVGALAAMMCAEAAPARAMVWGNDAPPAVMAMAHA